MNDEVVDILIYTSRTTIENPVENVERLLQCVLLSLKWIRFSVQVGIFHPDVSELLILTSM